MAFSTLLTNLVPMAPGIYNKSHQRGVIQACYIMLTHVILLALLSCASNLCNNMILSVM